MTDFDHLEKFDAAAQHIEPRKQRLGVGAASSHPEGGQFEFNIGRGFAVSRIFVSKFERSIGAAQGFCAALSCVRRRALSCVRVFAERHVEALM